MRWLLLAAVVWPAAAWGATVEDLVRAYPAFLAGFDGRDLVWRDGTRMDVTAGSPSILEQMAEDYPAGAADGMPRGDPGRARNRALFDKMYGDCRVGAVAPALVRVVWLPTRWGRTVSFTAVNGADAALAAVSAELDGLPLADERVLYPIGGTFNCRVVAGTADRSMHAWGAAIDLNPAYGDYWRWRGGGYRNRVPMAVVAAFERQGFIWGGRWSHYDTMHFEYRPELLLGR